MYLICIKKSLKSKLESIKIYQFQNILNNYNAY